MNNELPDWIKRAAARCSDPDAAQIIAEEYANSIPRPIKEDYRELTEAFASVVYQIFEPGNEDLLSDVPVADRMRALSNYFCSNQRAHYALNTLVALAMRNRERRGWSPDKRKQEDDRQQALMLQAMYDLRFLKVGVDSGSNRRGGV